MYTFAIWFVVCRVCRFFSDFKYLHKVKSVREFRVAFCQSLLVFLLLLPLFMLPFENLLPTLLVVNNIVSFEVFCQSVGGCFYFHCAEFFYCFCLDCIMQTGFGFIASNIFMVGRCISSVAVKVSYWQLVFFNCKNVIQQNLLDTGLLLVMYLPLNIDETYVLCRLADRFLVAKVT